MHLCGAHVGGPSRRRAPRAPTAFAEDLFRNLSPRELARLRQRHPREGVAAVGLEGREIRPCVLRRDAGGERQGATQQRFDRQRTRRGATAAGQFADRHLMVFDERCERLTKRFGIRPGSSLEMRARMQHILAIHFDLGEEVVADRLCGDEAVAAQFAEVVGRGLLQAARGIR